MFPHLPTSTLFPYTTLFRSDGHGVRSLCESNVLPADGLLQKGRWRILNSLVRHRPWSALFYYQEFCTSASFNESRSEERRVGKGWRSGQRREHDKEEANATR